MVMDSEPFRDMQYILQELNDERIWVFAEWVRRRICLSMVVMKHASEQGATLARCCLGAPASGRVVLVPVAVDSVNIGAPSRCADRLARSTRQSSKAGGRRATMKSCTTSQTKPSEVHHSRLVMLSASSRPADARA